MSVQEIYSTQPEGEKTLQANRFIPASYFLIFRFRYDLAER